MHDTLTQHLKCNQGVMHETSTYFIKRKEFFVCKLLYLLRLHLSSTRCC